MSDSKVEQGKQEFQKKRPRTRNTEEWTREVQVLLANAKSDPDIRARLEAFGYDEAKLAGGQALYAELSALSLRQKAEYGERYEATEAAVEARRVASDAYSLALKVARIALRDRTRPRSAMMVDGPRNKSLSGWLKQAEAFYGNLLNDEEAMALMAKFGYTAESLRREQGLVKDISVKYATSHKEAGEAQGFTLERDRKMDELARWVSDLRGISKLVFKDLPDKLKILGI